jgi:L-asparagine oxygenase
MKMKLDKISPAQANATYEGLPYAYEPSLSRERWLRAISDLDSPHTQSGPEWEQFKKQAIRAAADNLPQDIKQMLQHLAESNDSECDGIVIDNLPNDATHQGRPDTTTKVSISEAVLLGMAGVAQCEIIGYRQEKQGALIHRVEPQPGKEHTQSNAGRVKFNFHSDNAFLSRLMQPQLLGLLGSVNDGDVATLLLTLEQDIIPNTPTKLLHTLRQPIFRISAPESFDFGGYIVLSTLRPLIYEDENGQSHIALPGAVFRQENQRAERAMRDFKELLSTLTPRSIVVRPGRFLAFRNTRVVHGRSPIVGNRLLHRIYFTRSLAPRLSAVSNVEKARVLDVRLLLGT